MAIIRDLRYCPRVLDHDKIDRVAQRRNSTFN